MKNGCNDFDQMLWVYSALKTSNVTLSAFPENSLKLEKYNLL